MSPLKSSFNYSFGEGDGIPRIITDGLVLNLDAGRQNSYAGIGTVWSDLSGGGNNGTLYNTPTYSSSNGGSLSFDGSNEYVTTGFTYANNSDFTMSCWMKTSTPQLSGLMGIRTAYSATWYQAQVYITGGENADNVGNYITFSNFSATGGFVNRSVFVDGVNVTNGNWRYIVVNSNSTVSKVYIDGVLVGTSVVTSPPIRGLANFIVGAAGNYPSGLLSGYYYNGQISSTSFYNRELSAAEILQNFQATRGRYGV